MYGTKDWCCLPVPPSHNGKIRDREFRGVRGLEDCHAYVVPQFYFSAGQRCMCHSLLRYMIQFAYVICAKFYSQFDKDDELTRQILVDGCDDMRCQ